MVRYRAGLQTQERILGATRSLLAEAGLEGITLKGICERAGVLPGSFYNLFETKEEAVVTVVRQALEAVDPDPARHRRDTVEDLAEAYIRFICDEPVLARIYVQLAVAGSAHDHRLRGRILRHHANRLDRFSAGMRRSRPGLDPAEARRRAEFLLAALQGLTIWNVLDPAFDFAAHARDLLASVVGPE
ncbi:MAG: TetR/AcrR family transcriptional regulator [Acidimicrobiia bacterium]|nr:TetR/AcrR family transcriptional regulator [Acidimicrobiia bacterium]